MPETPNLPETPALEGRTVIDALEARAERRESRRAFFAAAIGATAAGAFAFASAADAQAVTDPDVLNFALNLEYLEANFYNFAVNGVAIGPAFTSGTGTAGAAAGGRKVTFADPVVARYAKEIAGDELAHVVALRNLLGIATVAQPAIDLGVSPNSAFSLAAQTAGLVNTGVAFDPYASDDAFLQGAFLFEDVGVSAYKGAAPLISNLAYLDIAAGLLAAEAYHAAIIRQTMARRGLAVPSEQLSNARDSFDGSSDIDQGITPIAAALGRESNIIPTDANGITYSRTTGQVLNILYLTSAAVTLGGFFPAGVNGTIKTSAANAAS